MEGTYHHHEHLTHIISFNYFQNTELGSTDFPYFKVEGI